MARKNLKKEKKEKNEKGFFKRLKEGFIEKSIKAQRATVLLVIFSILAILTGYIGFTLFTPAKDIFFAESTFTREKNNITNYPKESEERAKQEVKAAEAEVIYLTVMDNYLADTNFLVRGYAEYHKIIADTIIILALVTAGIILVSPYISIVLMLKKPVEFIFAVINIMLFVINIILVAPIKGIIKCIKLIHEDKPKKEKPISLKVQTKEAN